MQKVWSRKSCPCECPLWTTSFRLSRNISNSSVLSVLKMTVCTGSHLNYWLKTKTAAQKPLKFRSLSTEIHNTEFPLRHERSCFCIISGFLCCCWRFPAIQMYSLLLIYKSETQRWVRLWQTEPSWGMFKGVPTDTFLTQICQDTVYSIPTHRRTCLGKIDIMVRKPTPMTGWNFNTTQNP